MKKIDFFFDFISPFGYLASLRIDGLASKYNRDCDWTSILLGVSVVKVMGMKPLPQTPLKGNYLKYDFRRYARRHGIRISRELGAEPSNPLPAGRAFHWVKQAAPDLSKPFAAAVLAAYWRDGVDIGAIETLEGIGEKIGLDPAALREAMTGERGKDLLRRAVDRSLKQGVFGSPFFIVDEREPFFGVEKMELMEEWLSSGGW
jgi:2-hydroxychromene-2-carboxylate isomerase